MELVNIPDNTTGHPAEYEVQPTDWLFMHDDKFADIQITDHGTPNWFDDSVTSDVRNNWQEDEWKPRTISAFCRTLAPDDGLLRITFYPRRFQSFAPPSPAGSPSVTNASLDGTKVKKPPKHYWKYDLAYSSPVRFIEAHLNAQYRILPGSHRTLLYTIPWDDITSTPQVLGFFRYHDRELMAEEPEDHDMDVNQAPRLPVQKLPFEFDNAQRFQAIAWDETVGRVCFASADDTRLVVLDFAKRPKEGEYSSIADSLFLGFTLKTDFLGRRMPLPAEQDHDVMGESEPEPELESDHGTLDSSLGASSPGRFNSDAPSDAELRSVLQPLSEGSSSRKAVNGSGIGHMWQQAVEID